MFENQQLILKRCCSFPPPTLSGLPQQAFIFTLEALLHALKPLQPRSNFSLSQLQATEQVTDAASDTTRTPSSTALPVCHAVPWKQDKTK